MYIPNENRCCPKYVIKNRIIANELFSTANNFNVVSNISEMTVNEISL